MVFPDLDRDQWPDIPVLEPFLPKWSETASDAAPLLHTDRRRFGSIIGLILFIAKVRHDVGVAVSFLAGRLHCASEMDMEAAVHLSLYLCYTRDLEKIFYRGSPEAQQALRIAAGADASFRAHLRSSQSHLGFGHKIETEVGSGMHGPSGMCWAESRASRGLVPINIAAAEVAAGVESTKSSIYLMGILRDDFGIELAGPITTDEDNQATIDVVSDLCAKSKSMRESAHGVNFMRSAEEQGYISLQHVSTAEQAVNQLTKAQGAMAHCRDVPVLMGRSAVADSMQQEAERRFHHRRPILCIGDDVDSSADRGASMLHQEQEGEHRGATIVGLISYVDDIPFDQLTLHNTREIEKLSDRGLRKRICQHLRKRPEPGSANIPFWFVETEQERGTNAGLCKNSVGLEAARELTT